MASAQDSDVIDSYIDRAGIQGDTDFILKQLNEVYSTFKRINSIKVNLDSDKTFRQAAESTKKLRTEQDLYLQQQKDLETAYKKRIALESENARLLSEEKLLMQQRTKELKNEVEAQNAANNSIDQARAKLKLLRDERNKTDLSTPAGMDRKNQLNAEIDGLDDFVKVNSDQYTKQKINIGNYSGAVKTLEKALEDVRGKMDQWNKSGQTSETILASLVREEQLLNQLVSNQANGFASATAELRNNEAALQSLAAAGLQTSDFYKDLLAETGRLKSSVGDLKQEIKNLASDTSTLDGLIQGAEALSGIYGIAEGAAALFGEENEELQKTLVKLQAVSVILNGLQSVRNALQAQSSLMLLVETARTYALTAATRLYTFATGGATVAARSFNTALIAGGIGIVLLLISQAASAMGTFEDNTEGATESLEDFNAELEYSNKLLDENVKSLNFSNQIAIEKLKQRGATQKQLNDATIANLKSESEAYREAADEQQKQFDALNKLLGDDPEKNKSIVEKQEKLADDIASKRQKALDKEREADSKAEEFRTKVYEDGIKKRKTAAEKTKEYQEKEMKAQFELQKYYRDRELDLAKSNAGETTNPSRVRTEALLKALELEETAINAQRAFDLSGAKITASERVLINQKAEDNILSARTAAAAQLILIRHQVAESEKQDIADTLAFVQGEVDKQAAAEMNKASGGLSNRLKGIQDLANAELQIEQERYAKAQINREQYEARKRGIEDKGNSASVAANIQYYKDLLNLSDLPEEKRLEAIKQLDGIEDERRALELQKEEDFLNKKTELQQAYHDGLKNFALQAYDVAAEAMTYQFDRQREGVALQISDLELRKNKEIEAANQSILNADERERAVSEIEARSAAQREQLERKSRSIEADKARMEKITSILRIGIEAPLAAFKIKAQAAILLANPVTAPLAPLALAQIPVVLAGAALAAGLIAAKPIPKFFRGKDEKNKYQGLGWVDDGGKPEAIMRKDGTVEVGSNKPRITYLHADDIVLPDAAMLVNQATRKTYNLTQAYNFQKEKYEFDKLDATLKSGFRSLSSTIQNKRELIIKGISKKDILFKYGSNHQQYLND